MKSLCFLATLITVAVASLPVGAVEVNKRLLGLLGGEDDGGLVGGLVGGDGGLVGGLVGGEGGLVGGLLGGEGGLLGSILGGEGVLGGILGLKADILANLINTATGLASGILKGVLDLLASLTQGLEGKTTEPEIYAVFRQHKIAELCPLCGQLPKIELQNACKKFCAEQNWRAG
ncbi:unnamed protein product [Candidula unifasciata]|uniref:Uncharacterized protein n=1 Tax=Candidula unifasciata TaxID=100452 RepID=A0A8S3ZJ07_9EUPU|nr:unnamed protein product [Candidula unifasciata]